MIKALLLIVMPAATWTDILRRRHGILFILGGFLLPLLLLTAAGEGYGWVKWGKWQDIGLLKKVPAAEAVVAQAAQVLLSLVVVFAGAILLKLVGETFHGRHTYTQAFTTVAYGLSPLFLLRLLDAFRGVSPWVSWAIGIVLSIAVLYYGVPQVMDPDPPHAFGLFFMSSLLLVLITGMTRFMTASFLQGKFPGLQIIVSDVAERLPF